MKRAFLFVVVALVGVSSFLLVKYDGREQNEGKRTEREDRTGAMAALDFWTKSRAYPDNDIPAGKYYQAFLKSREQTKNRPRSVDFASVWNPIGPLNLQGRMISIAINPLNSNTVYVGTASGGLWRSYSGGLNADWQQIITGYPVRGVGAIAIDPTDTNVVYIGSGEVYRYQGSFGGQVIRTTRGSYGIGILKTTNAGASWSLSLNWSLTQQSGIQKLVIDPSNHNLIYAGTSEGLYASYDAGGNWTNILFTPLVEDIVVSPLNPALIVISAGDLGFGSGVFRSTDAGSTWIGVTGIPGFFGKTLLDMYPSNPNRLYASVGIDSVTDHGGLYTSTDFGGTWSLVYDHLNNGLFQVQGWYSHWVAVHPTDSTQIVQAGVPIFKSTDAGSTFWNTTGYYSDNHAFARDPNNANVLYSVCDDGIYRSTDFGTSWANVGYGLITGQFYNGFSSSQQDSLLAIGQSQDHIPGYRYLGSTTWDHGSAADESGWTGINPANDHIVYAGNRFGGALYWSTDRGATWPFGVGFESSGAWNSPFVISPANPSVIYFGDVHVHKSTNGGSSFSITNSGNQLDGNPALSMAMGTTSQDTVYVGMAPQATTGHLFRTTNGGTSWTNITGTTPNRYPMDLAVDPHDSKTVYAAFGGFGTGHLFKSTNAGTNWSDITGTLPDVPTTAVAIDPQQSNNVYAGNDLGVYVSTDAGTTWSSFSDGFPDAVIVADLSISPSNRMLRAVTHGNGIYERKLLGDFPPGYFDYSALSLLKPASGEILSLYSHTTPLAMVRNLSAAAHADSFTVEYRILSDTSEVYGSTQRIPGLGLGENRLVSFNPPFVPPATGEFRSQVIVTAGDMDATNDTLSGIVNVAHPPDIAGFSIQKESCPYTEIVGGSAGPVGDDAVTSAAIPFQFMYDGDPYDSVQISTNGWVELGHGLQGSLYGLSTHAQLTGYFTPTLATTDHPTKAIGAWWADLATGGGQITYTTLGSAPNRVFVIQWKNVYANFDGVSSTATLNFQVRLNETTNQIDISYGQVVPGGNPGYPSPAAMGFKDVVGGDGRFYDLYQRGTGPVGFLDMSLSALANWPGPDSCYHILTNPTGISVSLAADWNMVSNPQTFADNSVNAIFPTAGGKAFGYSGSYQLTDSLVPGAGYWIKSSSPDNELLQGAPLYAVSVPVAKGWNMIGSADHVIAAPSGGIVVGSTFGYSGGGYVVASTLQPGSGYWVRTTASGTLSLGPEIASKSAAADLTRFSQLTIVDGAGRSQSLYFTANADGSIDPSNYLMPPSPPEGALDVRFAGGSMVETYPANSEGDATYRVSLRGAVAPVTLKYAVRNTDGRSVFVEGPGVGSEAASHRISGEGTLALGDARNSFTLRIGSGRMVPASYALRQNFPNPFNPSTSITFDIPARSMVSLKVFDILGREVMTPAHGEYEPGSYTLRLDFGNFSSGIYLYRLSAGTFSETKKMVVAK